EVPLPARALADDGGRDPPLPGRRDRAGRLTHRRRNGLTDAPRGRPPPRTAPRRADARHGRPGAPDRPAGRRLRLPVALARLVRRRLSAPPERLLRRQPRSVAAAGRGVERLLAHPLGSLGDAGRAARVDLALSAARR